MASRVPSRNAYAHSLFTPLILPLIRPIIAVSAPPTLSMDTPPPIAQCAAGTFTWQGGRPPYTLSVRTTDTDTPITVFSNSGLTDTVFHWVAAVAAGTDLVVELTDTGVSGAGGGRLSDNFVVEEGSDACLQSKGGTSGSTSGQAGNTSASPPSTSTSTSTSGGQPTASETVAPSLSNSPSASPSGSTTPATTEPSSSLSSTDGAPSQTLSGSAAGTTDSTGNTSSSRTVTPGGSSIVLATTSTSTSGRSISTSTGGTSFSGRARAGTIAGAAVGSLVAGFVLAAGLFCVWRARRARRSVVFCGRWRWRQRRGRLEPYEYPSADPAHTHPAVSTTILPPDHGDAVNLEGGPHQLNVNAEPVVRERQRPSKAHWDGPALPSTSTTQPTASQPLTAHLAALLHGAERSQVMDVDGVQGVQEIRAGDVVRRRWDLGDLDIENALRLVGFDPADYSERSASTAPPPYSQIA